MNGLLFLLSVVLCSSVCVGCPVGTFSVNSNFFSPYSTTACERFIALIPKPSFASVLTRLDTAVGTLPTYNPTGGPNGRGHVSFDRTLSQYLDAGPRTLNIATNGGFTAVVVVRFTGTVSNYERIMTLASGSTSTSYDNIFISRYGTTSQFYVNLYNSGTSVGNILSATATIVQNSWLTAVWTYRVSTNEFSLSVNGITSTKSISVPGTDRTVSGTYLARNFAGSGFNLNGDIAGLFFVDEYLNTDATTEIVNAIMNGIDMTDTTCGCQACPAGTYSTAEGVTSCVTCNGNSSAPTGSSSFSACVCNPGYESGVA